MNQGNYTVKALANITGVYSRLRAQGFLADTESAKEVEFWLRRCQPFFLPKGGYIFDSAPERYLPRMLKLPYRAISLEFEVPDNIQVEPGTQAVKERLFLCVQGSESNVTFGPGSAHNLLVNESVLVFLFGNVDGQWVPCLRGMVVPVESAKKHFAFENVYSGRKGGAWPVTIIPIPMFYSLTEEVIKHSGWTKDIWCREAMLDLTYETEVLMQLLCALECKNVSLDTIEPPDALNRKRARAGKLPLLSYKVLTVEATDGATVVAAGAAGTGTHASPRTHLRRGHIRRLPSGPIWVNATVVRGASRGLVMKDYDVRAAA